MDSFAHLLSLLVVVYLSSLIYRLLRRDKSGQVNVPPVEIPAVPAPDRLPERFLPLWRRAYRSVADRLRGRWTLTCEMSVEFTSKPYQIRTGLFYPRILFYIDAHVPPATALKLTGVKVTSADACSIEDWGLQYDEDGQRTRIRIMLKRPASVSGVRLEFAGEGEEFPWEVRARVARKDYADSYALFAALRDSREGRPHAARTYAQEYLEHSDINPHIHLLLGGLHRYGVDREDAKLHLLSAMALGQGDAGIAKYRALCSEDEWLSDEELARLRSESSRWSVPGHHGAVILARRIAHTLSVHGWNIKRSVEVLQVRRAVAGRILTNVGFSLNSREVLLFTRARLIPSGKPARELPLEQFTVREDRASDFHVTTLNERTGIWLLPDFEAGDVLEWYFETMHHEGRPLDGGREHSFIVSSPTHPLYPTLEGAVTVRWRPPVSPRIDVRPQVEAMSTRDEAGDVWHSRTIEVKRQIPRRAVTSPYHHYLLNPVVTCASVEQDWAQVGRALVDRSQGGRDPAEQVPEPLASFMAAGTEVEDKLVRAYYWVRDSLKYAAIQSAQSNIGRADRARAIVCAGVADCKDRSYLLYLACRSLHVKAEYVFVSYDHGLTFAHTPADQFDHVMVRARVGDRWVYMDATNSDGVFGSVPYRLQGMTGLATGESCEIVELPVDPPGVNGLEITETFDALEGDWLCGTFHLRLFGNLARMADEAWKLDSLLQKDDNITAQSLLDRFLPNIRVQSHTRIRETSDGDALEVSGTHRRGPLVTLGDRRVGTLSWSEPTLPNDRGRHAEHQDVFAFVLPVALTMEAVLAGPLAGVLRDASPDLSFKNNIGEIRTATLRRSDEVRLRREISIPVKYVRGEELKGLPDFLDALDRAMRLGLSFERED